VRASGWRLKVETRSACTGPIHLYWAATGAAAQTAPDADPPLPKGQPLRPPSSSPTLGDHHHARLSLQPPAPRVLPPLVAEGGAGLGVVVIGGRVVVGMGWPKGRPSAHSLQPMNRSHLHVAWPVPRWTFPASAST
jgi:hypothetical protein